MERHFQDIIFIINNNEHDRYDYACEIKCCLNNILSNNYNTNKQIDKIEYMLILLDDIVFDNHKIKIYLNNLLSDVYDSLINQQIDEHKNIIANNITISQKLITDYFKPIT